MKCVVKPRPECVCEGTEDLWDVLSELAAPVAMLQPSAERSQNRSPVNPVLQQLHHWAAENKAGTSHILSLLSGIVHRRQHFN